MARLDSEQPDVPGGSPLARQGEIAQLTEEEAAEAAYNQFVCSGGYLAYATSLGTAQAGTDPDLSGRDLKRLGSTMSTMAREEMTRLCPARVSRAVLIPGLVESDFRRMRVPAPVIRVQPEGESFLQIPLNLMAVTKPLTRRFQLLGVPVVIRVSAQEFSWSVTDLQTGKQDGESIVTTDPGQRYEVDNSVHVGHTFGWPGKYRLNLSTSFAGEYSLDGGSTWTPIPGEVTTTSRPLDITAVEQRSYLINDPDPTAAR